MKITKRQLRRIIKEEKAKVLAEQKIRRIVRRRLMEAAGVGGKLPQALNTEGPYPPEWHIIMRSRDVFGPGQGPQGPEGELFDADSGVKIYTNRHDATWMGDESHNAQLKKQGRPLNKFQAVSVNDALAQIDPSDSRYQMIDKAAAKKAGKKKAPGKIKLNTLTGWERLRDHPQWNEGMSDVLAAVKKNGGRRISAYMDEETASDRNDLVQLENGFKETKRINHETAMDSGTIIIGTVGGQPVAVWDVMGYQTWMY